VSAETANQAVNGTFELLGKLDNPYIAITFLICIAIVLVCLATVAWMVWTARNDRKDNEIRWDNAVKTAQDRYDTLLTQTRSEFREMHNDNITTDRELDKTLQNLSSNYQQISTLLTALVTMRGGSNGG